MSKLLTVAALACLAVFFAVGGAGASTPGADDRVTVDCVPDAGCGGYVSAYTLATGIPYTDATLAECSISHGRQNEPAVAVDPRNTSLLLGSANDYCPVYNRGITKGAIGPIWMGYYRSLDGGASWTNSLVPGYPDDASPYRALSQARTATAGDPVIAWDSHGRAFFGSESSNNIPSIKKTQGDVWVARYRNPGGPDAADTTKDGLEYYGTTVVATGSSAPNLLGKFNDKTAIEVDRTGGSCDGNVYFSWSRFNGSGANEIYFVRSTDHGVTFSQPMRLESGLKSLQFPDISVTSNGHVYVTFRSFSSVGPSTDAIYIVKSTDCGKTFSPPTQITTFIPNDPRDVSAPEPVPTQLVGDDPSSGDGTDVDSGARDCGDFADACSSGYTFFRRDTQVRSTADQYDAAHEWIYMVYDATKPGTEEPTGTTYGTDGRGVGGQAGIFFVRYDGATGAHTAPALIDDQATGHQVFPDISADGGVLHAIWWDSRNDECYSVTRPIGNCADRKTVPSLDVYGATSTDAGTTWTAGDRITDVSTNPNYEQFDNRSVPFAGDYLWVTSLGSFAYTVQTKKGPVSFWSGDLCPHDGGIDQNIYGDLAP